MNAKLSPLDSLSAAIEELGVIQLKTTALQTSFDDEERQLKSKFVPRIDSLTARQDKVMDTISQLVEDHWSELMGDEKGKTLVLRGGTVKVHTPRASLIVENEDSAIKWLRNRGLLKRFTKLGKRTIVKDALKKAPDVVARMKKVGVYLDQPENLVVKPAKTQLEKKRPYNPLRRRVTMS